MTGLQKFIKYAAIVFGIYLAITIVWVLLGIAREFVSSSKNNEFRDLIESAEEYQGEDISRTYENIKNLDITAEVTELIIKNGDSFKVEGTNIPDRMEISQEGDTLKISDETLPSSLSNENISITIYIPKDVKLDSIDLEINYVSADIETLNTANLNLDIYDNYCEIDEIVADSMEFKNEYGNLDIYQAEVGRLSFDSESGIEDVNVKVTETAKIDLEYSDTDMNLIGTIDDYQINYNNQFGNTYITGIRTTSDNSILGTGSAIITLENSNADVYIDFRQLTNESNL